MTTTSSNPLLDQLIAICKEVFAGKHYEAANHLLNAAIHFAADIENEEYLDQIERLARQQHAWINENAPESIMSSRSARARNGLDLYAVTVRQASAHALIIRQNNQRKLSPLSRWPDE